jgi:hypothetical protein
VLSALLPKCAANVGGECQRSVIPKMQNGEQNTPIVRARLPH